MKHVESKQAGDLRMPADEFDRIMRKALRSVPLEQAENPKPANKKNEKTEPRPTKK